MTGTTRELNFTTITFVCVVFVLLLIVIVAGSTAWFRYEFEKQRQERIAEFTASPELIASQKTEQAHLSGEETGVSIEAAMREVADRY
ncbi:MAG: hypothetical protein AAGE65_12920 [Planctomycetota bacterium]